MIEVHDVKSYHWVEVVEPQPQELRSELAAIDLPEKYFDYMMDTREQPRATYDELNKFGVLVVRALPFNISQKSTTVPIFIGFRDGTLITVCHDSQEREVISAPKKESGLTNHIMDILRGIVDHYLQLLDQMSENAERLEMRGHQVTNKRLSAISDLKRKLIYLRSACAGNLIAIEQLKELLDHEQVESGQTSRDHQAVTDLLIEYRQCQNSFEIVSTVVSEFEDTFGNVINNRLNQTMQFLTVWSLVLAIPPIVSGFYGMNMFLPWASGKWAWAYSLVITLVLVGLMIWYLKRNKKL